jgi:hypothetical protein
MCVLFDRHMGDRSSKTARRRVTAESEELKITEF